MAALPPGVMDMKVGSDGPGDVSTPDHPRPMTSLRANIATREQTRGGQPCRDHHAVTRSGHRHWLCLSPVAGSTYMRLGEQGVESPSLFPPYTRRHELRTKTRKHSVLYISLVDALRRGRWQARPRRLSLISPAYIHPHYPFAPKSIHPSPRIDRYGAFHHTAQRLRSLSAPPLRSARFSLAARSTPGMSLHYAP